MEVGKITYIGYLGHQNLGDEALYEINKRIFIPYTLIPDNYRHHSKFTLFGGGTLLPDWTWRIKSNRFNYAFGVGVKDPAFWGPYNPILIKQIKRFNFRYIGVRGYNSKKILDSWGIKSDVIGDPCLLYEPDRNIKRETSRIGINVGGSRGLIWGGNEKKVITEIAKVCKILVKQKYNPILIPFWSDDLPYVEWVSKASKTEIFYDWTDIQKVINFIASCNILIAKKLHSIVFSAASQTPFLSIEYRPKCRDFAETIGFKDFNMRTNEVDSERIIKKFNKLLGIWDEMEEVLYEKVKLYRRKLIKFVNYIKSDVKSLGVDWKPSYLENVKWYSKQGFIKFIRKTTFSNVPPGCQSN